MKAPETWGRGIFGALLVAIGIASSSASIAANGVPIPQQCAYQPAKSDQGGSGQSNGEGALSVAAPISQPSTADALISNLIYIAKHDLALNRNFYSDDCLIQLLGAMRIQGERTATNIALSADVLSISASRVADIIIRRDENAVSSILLQINDAAVRPDYVAVERIVGDGWRPSYPESISPHARYVAPTDPHGNADMVWDFRTALASYKINADFLPDGRLHHLDVYINPNVGRN